MDEKRMDSTTWIHTATKGIRFGPDREAVTRELLEHMEDKTADLMRIFPDMGWEEARQRALDGMGDPAEIGRDLARVHRPWLGWLWRVSQWVLGLAAFVTVIVGLHALVDWETGWYETGNGLNFDHVEAVLTYVTPDPDREMVDGYRITMPEAVRVEIKDELRVGALLRTASPRFWERESRNLCCRIRAVDSLGNVYPSYEERWGSWGSGTDEWKYVNGHASAYGPFHTDYAVWVCGVDPAAEWVRLEYDWLGRAFSMTVAIKEAGA